jgi:hypothetical protein
MLWIRIRNSRLCVRIWKWTLTFTRKLRILRSAHFDFTVFTYVQNVLVKECPVNPEEVQMHPVMLEFIFKYVSYPKSNNGVSPLSKATN